MFAVLVLLTAAVYSSVHRFGFVDYDDPDYLVSNPHIHSGLSMPAVRSAFSTFQLGNYSPLVTISYCIDQSLFRLSPGPMHVENVLLHLLTGLLLWRLIFVCTGKLDRGFVVAALFLIHPMHVESVAWISERKNVLSTPLLLAAMIAYVGFCSSKNASQRWTAYVAMLLFFALSLLAKSMGVTLPAVLLLMDVWPLRRWPARGWFRLVIEKLPLFALAAATAVAASVAQHSVGATSSISELSIIDRIDNALVCYVIYIVKLAVPTNLAVFYQHPGGRPLPAVIASVGLLMMITIPVYRARKSRPYLLVGWLWFVGTLVPVIGLVQVGSQAMADRYGYFPSIGLFIAAVWFCSDGMKSARIRGAMTMAVLAAFSITAWKQASYWQDSRTLFSHAAAVADPNPVAHLVLGKLEYEQGNLNAAFAEYQAALKPFENARAYNGLGNCVLGSDVGRAIQYYRRAIELNPHLALFHLNLAHALWINGQTDDARQEARAAQSIDPHVDLSQILADRDKGSAAK